MKSCLTFIFLIALASSAMAAEWTECRNQKLQSLELSEALREGELLKGYRDRSDMRAQMRATEKWVWKNCRRHSSALRDLAARR